VFGTSIFRGGKITATNGVIDQSNFNDYAVARIDEAPYQTNVYVVDSSAPPAGVGEPGVSVMAPALSNAIFAATGKRIRELPLSKAALQFSNTCYPGARKRRRARNQEVSTYPQVGA